MAQQHFNPGVDPTGAGGDTNRTANQKWELNFNEVYSWNTSGAVWTGVNTFLSSPTVKGGSVNFYQNTLVAPVNTMSIGGTSYYGANGSADALGGTINFRAAQNWTPTLNGSDYAIRLINYNTTTLIERFRVRGSGAVIGGSDNSQTIGEPSTRWSVVYAATGSINTSDAREKTEVSAMSPSEINASIDLAKEIGTYKFIASIEAKGDDARTHIGMTVQRAIEIMEYYNLDPYSYSFICHDEWGETEEAFDDDGTVISNAVPAGDRYGFRVDQLLLFIASGFNSRLLEIEGRFK